MGMFKLKGFMGWSYNMSPSCHMRFPHPWFVLTAHCQSGFCSSPQIGIYIRCICIRCICNIWVKGWTTFIQWHKPKEKKLPNHYISLNLGWVCFHHPQIVDYGLGYVPSSSIISAKLWSHFKQRNAFTYTQMPSLSQSLPWWGCGRWHSCTPCAWQNQSVRWTSEHDRVLLKTWSNEIIWHMGLVELAFLRLLGNGACRTCISCASYRWMLQKQKRHTCVWKLSEHGQK